MNSLSLVEKIACLSGADKEWLERLIDRVLISQPLRKGCDCHVVDPKKQNMIIWPSQNPKHPQDLIVQFANQKFIAMPRVDKRGMKYWKVRDFYENESNEPVLTSSTSPSESKLEEELIKSILNKPINEQTAADREKWAKWVSREKTKENVPQPENVPNQGEKQSCQ